MAPSNSSPSGGPTLIERLHAELRQRHYSPRTGRVYEHWVRRLVGFHNAVIRETSMPNTCAPSSTT